MSNKYILPTFQVRLNRLLMFIDTSLHMGDYTQAWHDLLTLYHACPEDVQEECKETIERFQKFISKSQHTVKADFVFTQVSRVRNIEDFLAKNIYQIYGTMTRALFAKGYLEKKAREIPTNVQQLFEQ